MQIRLTFWSCAERKPRQCSSVESTEGAELDTDHYLLVGSCRLQLSQPRASQPKPRGGYDSGLLYDAMVQKTYAVMITD